MRVDLAQLETLAVLLEAGRKLPKAARRDDVDAPEVATVDDHLSATLRGTDNFAAKGIGIFHDFRGRVQLACGPKHRRRDAGRLEFRPRHTVGVGELSGDALEF